MHGNGSSPQAAGGCSTDVVTAPRAKTAEDSEVVAMKKCDRALKGLDWATAARVLDWCRGRVEQRRPPHRGEEIRAAIAGPYPANGGLRGY